MSLRDDIAFEQSRAVLIGTGEYTAGFEDRRPMPAARYSLAAMRRLLTGPCEWPEERICTFQDERDSGKLLRTITTLIQDVTDVLVFYYVGHGQPLSGNGRYDLGLALSDTSEETSQRELTSLRFRDLREQVERNSQARIKILILDCCCSGIATKYAEPSAIATIHAGSANPVRGTGTYIWAACGHSQETFFETNAGGLTYFAKFMVEAVRAARGAPPPGATVADLHDEVRRRLREASIPEAARAPVPDLHYSGRPDQFLFVRAKALSALAPAASPSPEPPQRTSPPPTPPPDGPAMAIDNPPSPTTPPKKARIAIVVPVAIVITVVIALILAFWLRNLLRDSSAYNSNTAHGRTATSSPSPSATMTSRRGLTSPTEGAAPTPAKTTVQLSDLPDPCQAASTLTVSEFGVGAGKPPQVTGRLANTTKSCDWATANDGTQRSYRLIGLSYAIGKGPLPSGFTPAPVSLPGVNAVERADGLVCQIVWTTSFGVIVVMVGANTHAPAGTTPHLCTVATAWAEAIFANLPR